MGTCLRELVSIESLPLEVKNFHHSIASHGIRDDLELFKRCAEKVNEFETNTFIEATKFKVMRRTFD